MAKIKIFDGSNWIMPDADTVDGKHANNTANNLPVLDGGAKIQIGNLPTATTGAKGIVQLNDSISSTSSTEAATAKAVKTAYDKANHAHPFAASSHTHDDRYYTESEIDTKLNSKAPAAGSTSITRLGSQVTFGSGDAFTILQNGGTWHQKIETFDNSTSGDAVLKLSQSSDSGASWKALLEVRDNGDIRGTSFNGFTIGKSVPSNAVFTDTWRGIQDNLTSTATDQSLSANQGKVLKGLIDGKAASSHTHTYLPLAGGTMTGAITSSLTTSTHINGNKGTAIINSTAGGDGYTMLAKMNSKNGAWTLGNWTDTFSLFYTAKATIDAGTNNTTKRVILLSESGNSTFPGTVTAPTFSGNLTGNATSATTASAAAKLSTARTITVAGAVSGSASFDGSGNVTITTSDQRPTTNIDKTLTVGTSWIDTGISGANLATGSYVVQVLVNNSGNGFYNEYFTGFMSWYSGTTNSTETCEIVLHHAGHADNGRCIYLRTARTSSSGYLKLQIAASTSLASQTYNFKFRQLI